MTRTEAPKVFGGRLDLNLARTTPELPVGDQQECFLEWDG